MPCWNLWCLSDSCAACDASAGPQANDFEAYQQILRETAGPGTSGERYEVISRFLSTTEEYLHKLASKVKEVKLTQEASEAAAVAVSRARAQVGPAEMLCLPPISRTIMSQPVLVTLSCI
jgi:hypothetical protein